MSIIYLFYNQAKLSDFIGKSFVLNDLEKKRGHFFVFLLKILPKFPDHSCAFAQKTINLLVDLDKNGGVIK